MPAPDALPTPPPIGLYGEPLEPYRDGLRQKVPGGGYIFWKRVKDENGNVDWRPIDPTTTEV